jgi:DNA-binding NtrC family response regulator
VSEPQPTLDVVNATDAFSAFWPELASRLGAELRERPEPEPVRESRSAAVLLVCAGREGHAVDLLHSAHRAGLDGPLVVGAEADHHLAVALMRRGAGGYYALPADADRLEEELSDRVQRLAAARDEGDRARGREAFDFGEIVGEDPALRDALDRASRVIPRGDATVLVTGETGTGKELLARALHYNGPRAREPFVPVNCSAIPPNLLESELFGHEKGAFTDARAAKPGLFQVADGGSLFLDEVATLPMELQGKLLRVLESGEIRRVGGVQTTTVDVRIIAAANVDLRRRVREDEFREDLYYRLAVVPIRLPPLRERRGDVERLARHFAARIADEYGLETPEIAPEALRTLRSHGWPGNVRELRNAMERALLLSGDGPIRTDDLALEETSTRGGPGGEGRGPGLPFPATLDELEVAATRRMIELCDGNKSEAARQLGIPRSRLYRILDRAEGG